ncbi:hypothetical protein [Nocardia fluminea]|uniref:hypothetical protein n=1 Tax=Nocardia fluminea TaxID=134984 RepID=UPI0033FA4C88
MPRPAVLLAAVFAATAVLNTPVAAATTLDDGPITRSGIRRWILQQSIPRRAPAHAEAPPECSGARKKDTR